MLSRRAVLAASCALLPVPSARAGATVTIFAAASLKTALDSLIAPLRAARGHELRCVYAASSALARQIDHGAPADLFWSADREWMEWCVARALMQPDTIVDLLGNRLVVIAPADGPAGPIVLTPDAFAGALGSGRLALGETRAVPAGRYAKEALETLGIWPRVMSRLAETDNVRAALLLVARGEAPLGIVYASDVVAEPRVKIVADIPASAHKPILYPLGIVRTAQTQAARETMRFFQSAAARTVFAREGFSLLTPEVQS